MLPPARPHPPALPRCAEETHTAGMRVCWKTPRPSISQPAMQNLKARRQSVKHGARRWSTRCHCMRSAQHCLQQPCQCDALAEWVSVSCACLQQQPCRVAATQHTTLSCGSPAGSSSSGTHSICAAAQGRHSTHPSIHARRNTISLCCRVLLLGLCTARRLHLPHKQAVHCCCCHAGS